MLLHCMVTMSRKMAVVMGHNKCIKAQIIICTEKEAEKMKYVCDVCGWIYDEAEGYPEGGIAPGTRWEDVPEDFACPLCAVDKENFSQE